MREKGTLADGVPMTVGMEVFSIFTKDAGKSWNVGGPYVIARVDERMGWGRDGSTSWVSGGREYSTLDAAMASANAKNAEKGSGLARFIQDHDPDGSMKKIGLARRAIVTHLDEKKSPRSAAGEIECPNCKGRLRFSRSGYNGHVHARCSTADCVSWME